MRQFNVLIGGGGGGWLIIAKNIFTVEPSKFSAKPEFSFVVQHLKSITGTRLPFVGEHLISIAQFVCTKTFLAACLVANVYTKRFWQSVITVSWGS